MSLHVYLAGMTTVSYGSVFAFCYRLTLLKLILLQLFPNNFLPVSLSLWGSFSIFFKDKHKSFLHFNTKVHNYNALSSPHFRLGFFLLSPRNIIIFQFFSVQWSFSTISFVSKKNALVFPISIFLLSLSIYWSTNIRPENRYFLWLIKNDDNSSLFLILCFRTEATGHAFAVSHHIRNIESVLKLLFFLFSYQIRPSLRYVKYILLFCQLQ